MALYYRTYYLGFGFAVTLLGLITFLILQGLQIPSGSLIDWLIGVAIFWWLFIITVIPWNIYFEAKEVISDAQISQAKEIIFEQDYLSYIHRVRHWSLIIAISLHLISAFVLYSLSFFNLSSLGYVSSAATLLLMGLRPAIRAYQYLATRLSFIRQQIKYPRDDVIALQGRFEKLDSRLQQLENRWDLDNPKSWIVTYQGKWHQLQQEIISLQYLLEQFQKQNQTEHEKITQETKQAIAQLTEDSRILSNVRELIQFFKTA